MLGALFMSSDPIFARKLTLSLIFGIFVSTALTLVGDLPVLVYAAIESSRLGRGRLTVRGTSSNATEPEPNRAVQFVQPLSLKEYSRAVDRYVRIVASFIMAY